MFNIIFFYLSGVLFCQKTNLDLSLGPGFIYSSSIYKSKNDRFIPIPFLTLKYNKLSLNGISISYNYYSSQTSNHLISLSFKPSGFNPEDGYYLDGMKKRKDRFFVSNSFKYITGKLSYGIDFSYDIISSKPSYIIGTEVSKTKRVKKGLLNFSLKLEYENANLSNYNYGVFSYEARPWRKEYIPKSVLIPSINFSLIKFQNKNQKLFLFSSIKYFSKNITKSPIIDKNYNVTIVMGYLFSL